MPAWATAGAASAATATASSARRIMVPPVSRPWRTTIRESGFPYRLVWFRAAMATRPAPVDFNPLTRIRREFRDERGLEGDLPPGDMGLSVKRARRFVDDPLGLLLDSYRRYGPVFTLRMGTTPPVWMRGREATHFILVPGTSHFTWRDGFMGDLIPLVGDGLLTTDGDYHDRARKALTPA